MNDASDFKMTGRMYVLGLIFSSILLSLLSLGMELLGSGGVTLTTVGRNAILLILLYDIWTGGVRSLWIMRGLIFLASIMLMFSAGDFPLWMMLLLVIPLTLMSFFAFSPKTLSYMQSQQCKK